MGEPHAIEYWDRRTGRAEQEQVFGDVLLRWVYGAGWHQRTVKALAIRRTLSRIVGLYQSSPLSRRRIARFVRDYRVAMDEFQPGPFRSFNDFFVRAFKPGARPFDTDPTALPAFAEGRYLAFAALGGGETFPVKGIHMSAEAVLRDPERAAPFRDGPALIARLCPVDYHRFHYPDDGRTAIQYQVAGRLHSVNPFALRRHGAVFATNRRSVGILETEHFGRLAYVEVGALCVGRIVQTHPVEEPFRRGAEKGCFLFGGSTVILFGEAGRWVPDADLLEQTARRRETLVRLGERVAAVR